MPLPIAAQAAATGMSTALLQHRGQVTRKGVGLEVYLTHKVYPMPSLPGYYENVELESVACVQCGKGHPQLYRFFRKPAGTFGCWVVFRYNGEEHVPDLSCPMNIEKLPRDAQKLTPDENAAVWHRQ